MTMLSITATRPSRITGSAAGRRRSAATQAERMTAAGLSVSFAGVHALSDVDLELAHGEVLGLIGPNGAGKTTLVNSLTGFQRPTAGRVALGDLDVTGLSTHALARLGVARTFQGVQVFTGLTLLENVEMGAVGCGVGRRAAQARALELLDHFAMRDLAGERCDALPPGIERKVGIMRAVASQPRFLLLDEPAAGLNDRETEDLREAVGAIRERLGCGILVIEHDMPFLMRLAERVHVLDYGRTLAVGAPDAVKNDPAVIAAYLGTASEADAQA